MSKGLIPTTLVIFACPDSHRLEVENIFGQQLNWAEQTLVAGSFKSEVHLKQSEADTEQLVSGLNALGSVYAEANIFGRELGTLFLIAPGLGIYRAQTNLAGEILLSEDRIRAIVEASAGNHKELQRMLRLALGQTWDDLLEPFRAANISANVVLFNRAV